MRKKNFFKRALAILLAASTIFTQLSFTDFGSTAVYADESDGGSFVATNYVVDGDFANGSSGWTFECSTSIDGSSFGYNTTSNYLDVWSNVGDVTFSISQIMTLPAGRYYFALDLNGEKVASKVCTLAATASNNTTTSELASKTSITNSNSLGWGNWTTFSVDEFTLAEETDVKLEISASMPTNDCYFDIDNIILYQYQLPPEYSLSDLTELITTVPSDYQNLGFTSASVEAVNSALSVASACDAESSDEDIAAAYTALNAALGGLIFDADIFVEKVNDYDKDSIRGVDISSYLALMDSFEEVNKSIDNPAEKRGFRDWDGNLLDKQGFFDLLADSGVNYVRLRVWNDPYNSTTDVGYGGGNNDLDKAVEMGKLATEADMKVLIDFHFSDFWADPGKQKAPKEWADYTVAQKADAISEMVTEALELLVTDNSVDVGMVQIGNETTASFCGESNTANMSTLFDAGCDAIHAFNESEGTEILAALHFTNPNTANRYTTIAGWLQTNNVDYDVFASSYYPFWHGTLSNLTSVLNKIATDYGKYVMVAETSWVYTYEEGDGHENTIRTGSSLGDEPYGVSMNDQAKEVRDVINAVNNVTAKVDGKKAGLGVFYWEPAWIPVQYAYDENGDLDNNILESNKTRWETDGSGWASSSATEYDADDAGKWYGGSSWDNQAMFDFDGNPLESLNVYKYVSYGAETELGVLRVACGSVNIPVGTTLTSTDLPSNATITYNDFSTAALTVTWSDSDITTVNDTGIGTYTVNGTVTANGSPYPVSCTVTVAPSNLLTNGSLEDSDTSMWTLTGSGLKTREQNSSDSKTGSYSAKYNSPSSGATLSQTITATTAGKYGASVYFQGKSGDGGNSGERIYLSVTNETKGITYESDNVTLTGWAQWVEAIVSDIYANKGDTLTLTIHIKANSGSWGTADDAYLYFAEAVPATELAIAESSYDLSYSDTQQIDYTITDYAALPSWSSSNESAVTVDENGVVTAVGIGDATITAETTDGSSLTDSCFVTVDKKDITDAAITLEEDSYTYDGTAKEPAVDSVIINGKTLTAITDYTVTRYDNNTSVGDATVTITGAGDYYTGTATANFTIGRISISAAVITLNEGSYTYDGNAKEPTIASVKLGDKDLTPDDYDVNYSKNTDAGTAATVTITGKGNYKDDAFTYFTINKASVSGASIRLNPSSYTFDNTDKRPAVTSVTLGGKALTANDYTVGYSNNRNVGTTATVTITGRGNYTGTATATFTIAKASKRITVSRTTQNKVFGDKAFALGAATTSGERPTYTLSNTKVARVDTAGKVTIIGCGTVVITIKSAASANYNAATDARVTLTVKPKKVSISSASSKRAGRLTASWKRDKTVTGYEVYYSTNKNFKNAKKVTVRNNRTTSTTITKGLTRGKKYYVRVRSYTTVGGKTVYGAYSGSKNATVKR